MPTELDDIAFRESIFAWLTAQMLGAEALSRDELSGFEFGGDTPMMPIPPTGQP